MQPTTPFNAESWTIRTAEVVAWLACVAFFYWNRWEGLSTATQVALSIVWMAYIFIRFCSVVRWHKGAQRGEGIQQHFIQMKVVAIYGLLVATITAIIHVPLLFIFLVAAILTVVSTINATMLHLYRKDTSTIPTNYYSHHKFTQEDA